MEIQAINKQTFLKDGVVYPTIYKARIKKGDEIRILSTLSKVTDLIIGINKGDIIVKDEAGIILADGSVASVNEIVQTINDIISSNAQSKKLQAIETGSLFNLTKETTGISSTTQFYSIITTPANKIITITDLYRNIEVTAGTGSLNTRINIYFSNSDKNTFTINNAGIPITDFGTLRSSTINTNPVSSFSTEADVTIGVSSVPDVVLSVQSITQQTQGNNQTTNVSRTDLLEGIKKLIIDPSTTVILESDFEISGLTADSLLRFLFFEETLYV